MARMVPFGDLIEEENRLVEVLDEEEYACGGVRLHGKGVFVREYKLGTEIKKKFVQHEVREGDIVYSTLFAKAGAFAVADAAVEGVVLSEKFPTFVRKSDEISLDYLKWFFRSGQLNRIAEEQMTGIAAFSLAHLGKSKFLRLKVPVPDKDRQAEVVRICERAHVAAAKGLAASQKATRLASLLPGIAAQKAMRVMPRVKIGDIGYYVLRHAEIKAGTMYSQVTVAMKHRGLRLRRICDGSEIKSPGQSYVMDGDVLFSRIDIRQGAIGFVGKDLEGAVVTRDFPIFVLEDNTPESRSFLGHVFATPEFMEQAVEASRGTTGRKKMKRPAFLDFKIPWPDAARRADVAAMLDMAAKQGNLLGKGFARQETVVKELGHSVVATLFAKDAGLI